ADAARELEITHKDGLIQAHYRDRLVLTYREQRVPNPPGTDPLLAASGYIHPVCAPCGVVVTNHFSPDHLHQRGIFSAWTKTHLVLTGPEGDPDPLLEEIHPDFWNIQDGTGRVRCEWAETGASPAAFRARHVMEVRWPYRDARHDRVA